MMYPCFGLLLGFISAVSAPEPLGCTLDGKKFRVGEQQYIVPGRGNCYSIVCTEGGIWSTITCGVVGVPDKWLYFPGDLSLSYPDCCGHPLPPLNIVPDVVDKLASSETLQVTYSAGQEVDLGNELTPSQTKSEPAVTYETDPDSYYLLCMTDPDAPSRQEPTSREFRHWLVGNIPGDGGMLDVSKGETLTEYRGPAPPQGTGQHRYVFLLYKQILKLTFYEALINITQIEERKNFSIRKFAAKYHLKDPVAVNVFQAQHEG